MGGFLAQQHNQVVGHLGKKQHLPHNNGYLTLLDFLEHAQHLRRVDHLGNKQHLQRFNGYLIPSSDGNISKQPNRNVLGNKLRGAHLKLILYHHYVRITKLDGHNGLVQDYPDGDRLVPDLVEGIARLHQQSAWTAARGEGF